MKLYFSPGACSLAPHIALLATGLPFAAERVSLRTRLTQGGADFRALSPKGYVPALELEDGRLLTENQVILQYLADLAPASGLAPAYGSFERYQLMEWLAWLSTELHKRFSPLFTPGTTEEGKQAAWAALAAPLNFVAERIDGAGYLTGAQFTVADAYLFAVLNWVGFAGFSLDPWPALQAYQARVAELPVVREALRREGLQ
ncbi:glutathione transferase GstA [Telluria beijingensis]|uniref:glutathione transferase GstA n=1 Tax=Telluria beijingensis TaxID=3068633 RepID=UPI0027954B3F|nr:glutathione transferase GstA [Massilia sp. REN29]